MNPGVLQLVLLPTVSLNHILLLAMTRTGREPATISIAASIGACRATHCTMCKTNSFREINASLPISLSLFLSLLHCTYVRHVVFSLAEWPRVYLCNRNLHIAVVYYMRLLLLNADCQAIGAHLLLTLCQDRSVENLLLFSETKLNLHKLSYCYHEGVAK